MSYIRSVGPGHSFFKQSYILLIENQVETHAGRNVKPLPLPDPRKHHRQRGFMNR
jgi:hypothetical protein